jgi:hypothetical protein
MKRTFLTAGTLALLGLAACEDGGTESRGGTPERLSLNVATDDACSGAIRRTMVLKAESDHLAVYEDPANPTGGLTEAEYQQLANTFDDLIHPVDVENFGEPSDIDENEKVIVLFTRAVNELTPRGAGYIVGGFFWDRDLFPTRDQGSLPACNGSNVAEMFYVLAPDPTGSINGHTRTKEYVRENSLATVAHEFQHLINASRRIRVRSDFNSEEIWMDEALSHIAEELTFFRASGLAPGQNIATATIAGNQTRITAFDEYQSQNAGRLDEYLLNVPLNSPIASNDELSTRGAGWWLLRYAADRKGGNQRDTWFSLVNNNDTGLQNFGEVFGATMPIINDFVVAHYADDNVPAAAAEYRHPSWNQRDLYANAYDDPFPLDVWFLTNGAQTFPIYSGSGAYLRFAVPAGMTAEIRTSTGADGVPGTCGAAIDLAVGAVHKGTPANSSVMCFPGGATGREYVYVPFFGSAVEGTLSLTVAATGVGPVIGPPNPARLGPSSARLNRTADAGDGGFHLRHMERQRAETARRLGVPRRSESAAAQAPATLFINVMRTK